MSTLSEYKDNYRNIILERRDGILKVQLHTRGGPLLWSFKDHQSVHAQLGDAFYQIARDKENKVIILTGTGDVFMTTAHDEQDAYEGGLTPEFWDRLAQEGKDMLANFLDIGAIVISAVNGPATFHAEIPTLADIVIASESTVFSDPHIGMGGVPGDGSHVWWPMVLGPNRGRSFLLNGERISAREALQLGLVAEVVPDGQELTRAWAIAAELAKKTPLTLRYSRIVLTQDIKRRLLNDLHYGWALESLASLPS